MLSSLLPQFLSCCYLTLLPVLVIPVKCTLNWTKASIQTELSLQNGVQMMWNKYQRLPSDTHKNMQIPSKARHSPLEDSESDFSPFVSVKRSKTAFTVKHHLCLNKCNRGCKYILEKKSKCTQVFYPLKMTYWAHSHFLQARLGFLSEADVTFHITNTLETENDTSQSKNKQHGGQWRCYMDHQVVHFTTVSLFTGYHRHNNALNQSRKTQWNYFSKSSPTEQSID